MSADQTSIPGLNQIFPILEWNLIFFAIENSRSFKRIICSTNSSSHCLWRDAEHIRLTAFRWRCDEVEMRGTCLEAEKSMQTKVKSYNQLLKIVQPIPLGVTFSKPQSSML